MTPTLAQVRARDHPSGTPLAIVAGGGSGKTYTVALRAVAMAATLDPQRIVMLSFTRKAAEELQARTTAMYVFDRQFFPSLLW
jgi:superfamily I DNA/RNA helicase